MRGFVIALAAAAALSAWTCTEAAIAASDDTRALVGQPAAGGAPPWDDGLLPANYRRFAAVKLLKMYLRDSDGPPEISQPRPGGFFYKTPHFTVRFRLSPTGANGMLLSFQDPPPRRYRCIHVEADRGTFTDQPYLSFRYRRTDPGDICDPETAFEPFAELEQMSGKVRGCLARGEKQCVVADAVAKPDQKPAMPSKRKREAKPATP